MVNGTYLFVENLLVEFYYSTPDYSIPANNAPASRTSITFSHSLILPRDAGSTPHVRKTPEEDIDAPIGVPLVDTII